MLKVLKSKDCSKPKTKKCANALTKYAKKRYSKKEEVIKKETIDVKAGSNNKIQIGTGNKMGSSTRPATGILNSLGGTYKSLSNLPQFSHPNSFSAQTGLSTPTMGYNSTASRWFAPQPAPTMAGTSTRFPSQSSYASFMERLKKLETKTTTSTSSGGTGAGVDAGTQFSGRKEKFVPIKDADGKITGYKKPRGVAPRDNFGASMKWDQTNEDGNELWNNPESRSPGNIPRGWVPERNDAGMVWNETSAEYETPSDDDAGRGKSKDV